MPKTVNWRAARADAAFMAGVFSLFMLFSTTAYGMYYIPSESMLPTLTVGDRVVVSKFAYGYSRYSVPFALAPDLNTADGRIFGSLPARGDIVVFSHPRRPETLIKRVIGLPGDLVAIKQGRLTVNGALAGRRLTDIYAYREHRGGVIEVGRFTEDIDGEPHEILERSDYFPGDDFGPVVVPANELFVMGDNRDNSLDSRFERTGVGFLPVDHLVGKAELVLFSTNAGRGEKGLKRHGSAWMRPL